MSRMLLPVGRDSRSIIRNAGTTHRGWARRLNGNTVSDQRTWRNKAGSGCRLADKSLDIVHVLMDKAPSSSSSFLFSLSLSLSPCRLTGEQRMVEQGSSGGSAKHGSTSSHPNTPGLILQKSSTGTPAPHAKHSAVSARQQNVISQKDSSLHPNTGSSTNPGGQMHPVTHTVGHAMRSPKLSHVVGHGLAQPDHVPPEHSQIS